MREWMAGCAVVLLWISVASGASFTLSDAALMSLDYNLQNGYFDPLRARILQRRDIPGPGVEFDIFYPGYVGNDGLFYAVSSPKGGWGGLLDQNIGGYNSFDLSFVLLSVNGQPTTKPGDYIAVGAMISKLNSTWGYKPYGLDLLSGTSYPDQVLAQTSSDDTETRLVGIYIRLMPFENNQWNPSGTTVTLRVAPASGADQLFPRPRTATLNELLRLASSWLQECTSGGTRCHSEDWNADEVVNLSDFAILSEYWQNDPWLMAWWRFDGDYTDSAGGYAGMPLGDPAFVDSSQGRVGSGAIDLVGNDAVVVNGFMGLCGTAARTTMAWIKTTGTVAPIVYWGDRNTVGGLWDMRVSSTGRLRLVAGGGPLVDSATAVNTGQWVHVAAVFPEGGNNTEDVQLYVNGALETEVMVTAGSLNTRSASAMRIGTNEAGTNFFTGLIDDLRVYDRALTAEEIGELAGL